VVVEVEVAFWDAIGVMDDAVMEELLVALAGWVTAGWVAFVLRVPLALEKTAERVDEAITLPEKVPFAEVKDENKRVCVWKRTCSQSTRRVHIVEIHFASKSGRGKTRVSLATLRDRARYILILPKGFRFDMY
jgi:hypothetical protein